MTREAGLFGWGATLGSRDLVVKRSNNKRSCNGNTEESRNSPFPQPHFRRAGRLKENSGLHSAAKPQPNEGLIDDGVRGRRRTRIPTRYVRSAIQGFVKSSARFWSAATEPAQLPLLTWNQVVWKSRALGLADAKAVNRFARHRSPRGCRVHQNLVKFFCIGCFSCWQRFIWNISALSRFTEEGRHKFRPIATWSFSVTCPQWSTSQKSSQENKISANSVTQCRPTVVEVLIPDGVKSVGQSIRRKACFEYAC